MTSLAELNDKKIAILGLGAEGLSTTKYLLNHGLKYTILDENLATEVPQNLKSGLLNLVTGAKYLNDLDKFDVIFRSPGVRLSLPALQKVKEAGKVITSQTKIFFDLCQAPIIGVTGTKGKGTTATLVSDILKKGGKKVFLGGNIGAPMLDFLDEVTPDSWVVLELSSFQLVDLERSPKIAVVLAITVDHLDYHVTQGAYWDAKSNIVRHQSQTDLAILNHDSPTSLSFGHWSKAKQVYFSRKVKVNPGVFVLQEEFFTDFGGHLKPLLPVSEVTLIGPHNLENIAAATAVAKAVSVEGEVIKETIRSFKGLPHRLEFVNEVGGVKFFDDSASTNPETTIAALRSFRKPEVFILGGSSKKADFSRLGQEICLNPNVVGVILIGEEGARIQESIHAAGTFEGFILTDMQGMKDVVSKAQKLTPSGGVVVLSPACASFDMFKNYGDRGDVFKQEVKLLHEIHKT